MPGHVVEKKVYYWVYAVLLVLLALTFGASFLHLGAFNMIVTLSIAVAKMALVALFFMHLRYSGHFTWVVAGAGLVWLAILFTLTLSDYLTRGWLQNW